MAETTGESQDAADFSVQVMWLALAQLQQQAAKHPLRPGQLSSVAQIAAAAQSLADSSLVSSVRQPSANQPDHTQPCSAIAARLPTFETKRSKERVERGGQDQSAAYQFSTDTRSREAMRSESIHSEVQVQENKSKLIAMDTRGLTMARERLSHTTRIAHAFHLIDLNGDRSVGKYELKWFFESIGTPKKLANRFIKCVDADKDDLISQEEFLRVCELPQFQKIADQLQDLHDKDVVPKPMSDRCMISRASSFRILWDATIVTILGVVTIMAPATLGFQDADNWEHTHNLDFATECIFLTDVVLNFRTGFITKDGLEVMRGWAVARKYLKSWFLLDLVTAIPYRRLGANLHSDPRIFRLIRIGKAIRTLRLLKLAKPAMSNEYSHVWNRIEDISMSIPLISSLCILKLLFAMLMICHWLGCLMAWAADGCVDSCEEGRDDFWRQYIASVYWALTTVTTVGYGDISPSTNLERLTAMTGMVIGGTFYGYAIGSITNVVTNQGLAERLYNERMAEVQAWLDYHRLPPPLRRRIRLFFACQFRQGPPPDESTITSRLSPDLLEQFGEFVVSREVVANPLFYGLPAYVLNRLVSGIQQVQAEQGEHIVVWGESGYAMFVVLEGQLVQRIPDSAATSDITLGIGDSFGEEVLCGFADRYEYDVFANEHCTLQSIPSTISKKDLHPDLMNILRKNYYRLLKASPASAKWKANRSIEAYGRQKNKILSLEDSDSLAALKATVDATHVRQEEIARSLQNLLCAVTKGLGKPKQRYVTTL